MRLPAGDAVTRAAAAGHARWAIEKTLIYAHFLLELVEARVREDGRLERDVCEAFADPALDLLLELRPLAQAQEQDEILRDVLRRLPLLSPEVLLLEADEMRKALLQEYCAA